MAKISPFAIMPPVIFLSLAGLFMYGLNREGAGDLPSTMIGRQAPELINITQLREDPAPTAADLQGNGPTLVNFWASWCGPCRQEHPVLEELSDSGITLIGINYKDAPDNALGFLAELGDPYTKIGADNSGRTGIEWGVYGVPETFVIDNDGTVLFRHPGPLTPRIVEEKIIPLLTGSE